MSEQLLGSDKGGGSAEISNKSVNACESGWMARWARTGSEAAVQGHDCLSLKEDPGCSKDLSLAIRPKMALDDSVSFQRCRDVSECRRVDKSGTVEEKHVLSFPMFNVSQQKKRSSILGGDIISGELQKKSCEFAEKNSLAVSSASHDLIGSSSRALGNKRPRLQSWMCGREGNGVRVDSDEGTSIAPAPYRFSQTARHFFFATKKTDVNLSEDVQLLRQSTVPMKLKGKMFSGFPTLFPDLLLHHQERVRPQSLGLKKIDEANSSAVCIKNESSAETDTLEMDDFQKNHHSGSTSSSSTKVKQSENQSTPPRTEIPDMNQEPPIVSDGHGGETSSPSKTQSMNVEHFLSSAEFHAVCYRTEQESELSSRWVKRLKMSSSDLSGCGTKNNMKMGEESLINERINDFSSLDIMKHRSTNPENKIQQPPKSESKNPSPQGKEITLLHPWIQRWCRNSKATTSHQPAEPEVSREAAENCKGAASEVISKKQFPSIGAMAFMGKALSGFSPSGLKKNGSLTVWKTRDLR